MGRRERTIFRFPCRAVLVAALLAACTTNHAEVEHARHSLFNTDFAVVYSAVLNTTRELYPNLNDSPGVGSVATAWHQVALANQQDDLGAARSVGGAGLGGTGTNSAGQGGTLNNTSAGGGGGGSMGMPTQLAYKRFFIRFDISVLGGRPWRVKVVSHAAEWAPGAAMPSELHGIAKPAWLEPRTDALVLAIYNKVKQYAVPMPDDQVKATDEIKKTDPTSFKDVPLGAGKSLAAVKDALAHRDYTTLRTLLADDLMWSLGGEPGADTAMAMWQADADDFELMSKVIDGGCGVDGDKKKVSCPAAAPARGQFQLVLEPRAEGWRVTSFVRAE